MSDTTEKTNNIQETSFKESSSPPPYQSPSQPGYASQISSAPPPGHAIQPGYTPQHGYTGYVPPPQIPQPGYAPQSGYVQQPAGKKRIC